MAFRVPWIPKEVHLSARSSQDVVQHSVQVLLQAVDAVRQIVIAARAVHRRHSLAVPEGVQRWSALMLSCRKIEAASVTDLYPLAHGSPRVGSETWQGQLLCTLSINLAIAKFPCATATQ